MKSAPDKYVAARGAKSLNRLFDPLLRLTMPERAFKRQLIEQAHPEPAMRVVDIGCGTGTLLLMLGERQPHAIGFGVDGDLSILQVAAKQLRRRSIRARLAVALAGSLPCPPAVFDCPFSSLMLHHLTRDEKRAMSSEACLVLKPGGELHIAD